MTPGTAGYHALPWAVCRLCAFILCTCMHPVPCKDLIANTASIHPPLLSWKAQNMGLHQPLVLQGLQDIIAVLAPHDAFVRRCSCQQGPITPS